MPTTTTNYGFTKPSGGEQVNVDVLNSDFDSIDTRLKANADSVAASVSGKYKTAIGDGSTTTYTVTHNLNNRWVTCQLFDATTGAQIVADVTLTTLNALTLAFATPPATAAYEVVVIG